MSNPDPAARAAERIETAYATAYGTRDDVSPALMRSMIETTIREEYAAIINTMRAEERDAAEAFWRNEWAEIKRGWEHLFPDRPWGACPEAQRALTLLTTLEYERTSLLARLAAAEKAVEAARVSALQHPQDGPRCGLCAAIAEYDEARKAP